jgi:hypothetical protein
MEVAIGEFREIYSNMSKKATYSTTAPKIL